MTKRDAPIVPESGAAVGKNGDVKILPVARPVERRDMFRWSDQLFPDDYWQFNEELLGRFPKDELVHLGYLGRCSTWNAKQYGKGGEKLRRRTKNEVHDIEEMIVPFCPYVQLQGKHVVQGKEDSWLSVPRPLLMQLVELLEKAKARYGGTAMIVARDWGRFFRSEPDKKALPRPEEWFKFHEMTRWMMLATLFPVGITDEEVHSLQCQRYARRAGSLETDLAILQELGSFNFLGLRKPYWDTPMRVAAERHGQTLGYVQRLLNRPVPKEISGPHQDLRWGDLTEPAETFKEAIDKGVLR
jgi:hypothetical protein